MQRNASAVIALHRQIKTNSISSIRRKDNSQLCVALPSFLGSKRKFLLCGMVFALLNFLCNV